MDLQSELFTDAAETPPVAASSFERDVKEEQAETSISVENYESLPNVLIEVDSKSQNDQVNTDQIANNVIADTTDKPADQVMVVRMEENKCSVLHIENNYNDAENKQSVQTEAEGDTLSEGMRDEAEPINNTSVYKDNSAQTGNSCDDDEESDSLPLSEEMGTKAQPMICADNDVVTDNSIQTGNFHIVASGSEALNKEMGTEAQPINCADNDVVVGNSVQTGNPHNTRNHGSLALSREMRAEAQQMNGTLFEVAMQVHSLKAQTQRLSEQMKAAETKLGGDHRVKRLNVELGLLQALVSEMTFDMVAVKKDITEMLSDSQQVDSTHHLNKSAPDEGPETTARENNSHATSQVKDNDCDCMACQKTAEYKNYMAKQNNEHGNTSVDSFKFRKFFYCNKCPKVFGDSSALENHKKEKHGQLKHGELYQCRFCGKQFRQRHNHARHEQTHTSESYACDVCGDMHKTKQGVSKCKHRSLNSDGTRREKNYTCDVCGKSYYTPKGLKRHRYKIHGIKPPLLISIKGSSSHSNKTRPEGKQGIETCHDSEMSTPGHQPDKTEQHHTSEKTKLHHASENRKQDDNSEKSKQGDNSKKRKQGDNSKKCKQGDNSQKSNQGDNSEKSKQGHNSEKIMQDDKSEKTKRQLDAEKMRPHQCQVCDQTFVTITGMTLHMRAAHKDVETRFKCEDCGETYPSMKQLNRHFRDNHSPYACSMCPRFFKSAKTLTEHMNVHTGELPFECKICNMKFPSTSALKNHNLRTHKENYDANKCAICFLEFKSIFSKNSHYLKGHTEAERIQYNVNVPVSKCDICGKVLRKEYMKKHIAAHDVLNNVFVCEICGKSILYEKNLRKHRLLHLTAPERLKEERYPRRRAPRQSRQGGPQDCEICGKTCSSMDSYIYHKNVHLGLKPYKCELCGKGFNSKGMLSLHKKKHSGEYPYRCETCGKGFLYRISLNHHYATHSSERPYTCDTCGMTFKHDMHLKRHVMCVHDKIRNHTCEVCGKKFGQKAVLQVHQRIHTGEKPHKCDICGQCFSDPSTLYKHKARHKLKMECTEDVQMAHGQTDNSRINLVTPEEISSLITHPNTTTIIFENC